MQMPQSSILPDVLSETVRLQMYVFSNIANISFLTVGEHERITILTDTHTVYKIK